MKSVNLGNSANGNVMCDEEKECDRILRICNACRYCEGFCAVFPAMTRRLEFTVRDIHYLANLCHNCGACLHACQYAPPHEFAVNVPKTMARVRKQTYERFVWPSVFAKIYQKNGLSLLCSTLLTLVVFLFLTMVTMDDLPAGGDFYRVFTHNQLVVVFGLIFIYAIFSLVFACFRFWRWLGDRHSKEESGAVREAVCDVLTLKYLDGGHGEGCPNENDAYTLRRRFFHHFTFYGFLFCFASTAVATIYHYLFGWRAPYPYLSFPVVLGTLGGIGLIIGTIGLLWMNLRRYPEHGDVAQKPMDLGFILLLFFVSVSGMLLLGLRETKHMPHIFGIHLAFVLVFFIMMPYGKFVHGFYRSLALWKWSIEKRKPNSFLFRE